MCDIAVWYKTNIISYFLSGSMNLMGLQVAMMCVCFFINLFLIYFCHQSFQFDL